MGSHDLAGFAAMRSEFLDEFSVARVPDETVAVLRPFHWTRPVAVGDQDVAVGGLPGGGRLNQGGGARLGTPRLAERQQQLALRAEFEYLIALDARVGAVIEGAAVDGPEIPVAVAAEPVR